MSAQASLQEVREFFNLNRLAQLACRAKDHAILNTCFFDSFLVRTWNHWAGFDTTREDYFSKCAEAWDKETQALLNQLPFEERVKVADESSFTTLSHLLLLGVRSNAEDNT